MTVSQESEIKNSVRIGTSVHLSACLYRYGVRLSIELWQSPEPTQQDHCSQQRQDAATEELRHVLETNSSNSG